jgi:hypothetical protein
LEISVPFAPSTANADVRTLADLFSSTSTDDVTTYADLSGAIGRSIKACRWLIYKALKLANAETGALFGTVHGVGFKRLSSQDAHYVGHGIRRKIRRSSRRGQTMIGRTVEMANDMPPSAKRKAYAEISVLGLIEHIARDRAVNHVSEQAEKPMPVAQVMRAMMEQLGAISGSPKE